MKNQKIELTFKIIGTVTTITLGIAGLIIDYKRKLKISDEDKEDIATLAANKVLERVVSVELVEE